MAHYNPMEPTSIDDGRDKAQVLSAIIIAASTILSKKLRG